MKPSYQKMLNLQKLILTEIFEYDVLKTYYIKIVYIKKNI